MVQLLYSLAVLIIVGSSLYWTRGRWMVPFLESVQSLTECISDKASDRLASLSSPLAYKALTTASVGNAASNADADVNDSMSDLDIASKTAISRIMKRRRLSPDEARRVFMEQRFKENSSGTDIPAQDVEFMGAIKPN